MRNEDESELHQIHRAEIVKQDARRHQQSTRQHARPTKFEGFNPESTNPESTLDESRRLVDGLSLPPPRVQSPIRIAIGTLLSKRIIPTY